MLPRYFWHILLSINASTLLVYLHRIYRQYLTILTSYQLDCWGIAQEVASLAAALLVVPSAVETPAALAGPELSQGSPLLERYSKVKASEKVVGAKAVLSKKVESAKQAAVNAPKQKTSSGEGRLR